MFLIYLIEKVLFQCPLKSLCKNTIPTTLLVRCGRYTFGNNLTAQMFTSINCLRIYRFHALEAQKKKKQPVIHLLKRLNEFLGLNRWRVDDLIDVLAVAVCIGGGDVDEGLKVVHLMGQAEELLCGNHIQLQGVSARERGKKRSVLK